MFPIRRRLGPPGSSIRQLAESGFAFAPACAVANARRDAVALAAYEMGDSSLGPWAAGRIARLGGSRSGVWQGSGAHPWLNVMDDTHHFVFLIDQVPVVFYLAAWHTIRRFLARSAGRCIDLSNSPWRWAVISETLFPSIPADCRDQCAGWCRTRCLSCPARQRKGWPQCVTGPAHPAGRSGRSQRPAPADRRRWI